jgi:hypothetical protein
MDPVLLQVILRDIRKANRTNDLALVGTATMRVPSTSFANHVRSCLMVIPRLFLGDSTSFLRGSSLVIESPSCDNTVPVRITAITSDSSLFASILAHQCYCSPGSLFVSSPTRNGTGQGRAVEVDSPLTARTILTVPFHPAPHQ